ncbi:MAG: radical SAM protein [Candidatus Cloacimonadaceae bacterium]|jgi:histone acetyltransferase (RNA polymerase elongator complex component)|nr:radical SAM protein [Candidatus Cloacimonadaceae bacterium]
MKKPDKSLIYPLFIPMQGCPGSCVYCDQRKISGSREFDLAQAEREAEVFVRRNVSRPKEIAFYGGTFTALPRIVQAKYLSAIKALLEPKDSIRISTHPAYIDMDTLDFLKENRVNTIELGIQDFDDNVLAKSGRGYDGKTAIHAARMVQNARFILGIQLMPGLPGSTEHTRLSNLEQINLLAPDLLRLYPTIVIQGTRLATMFAEGEYQALSLRDAINICADYHEPCSQRGIRIIKQGIPSNLSPQDIIAGPWHPAFGELVKQELLRRRLLAEPHLADNLDKAELNLLKAHGGAVFP